MLYTLIIQLSFYIVDVPLHHASTVLITFLWLYGYKSGCACRC